MPGQVNMDSELGRTLYELSREPDVLLCVEIGTWNGEGSTFCIAQGLAETRGRLVTIELDPVQFEHAAAFYAGKDLPVELVHGLAMAPEDYPTYESVAAAAGATSLERTWEPGIFKRWYAEETEMAATAPRKNVLREIVKAEGCVDLAFFDGGEFTTRAEFAFLEPYVRKHILLDDTNSAESIKNAAVREDLLGSEDWEIVRDELHQRNGWLHARRTEDAMRRFDERIG